MHTCTLKYVHAFRWARFILNPCDSMALQKVVPKFEISIQMCQQMAFKLPTHKWMLYNTEKVTKTAMKVSAHDIWRFFCLKCFQKCEIWNLHEKPQKKCFHKWFLTPGRPPNPSLKAINVFIVASCTCEIFGLFRVCTCVLASLRDSRPFGVVRSKKCSSWQKKKMLEIFFFFWRGPLLIWHFLVRPPNMSWNVPETVLVSIQTVFRCACIPFFLWSTRTFNGTH